jgi:putative acetyltransferase
MEHPDPLKTRSDITIRPAKADDAREMSALIVRTLWISNLPDYGADQIAHMAEQFTPEVIREKMMTRDVFVAVSASCIAGTISLNQSKLHMLFVSPDDQGKGIGVMLVRHLEHHAATKGVTSIRLSSSFTARGFYQKLEYKEVAFEEREAGSTYLMHKNLA